jgi:hypothetical protein
MIFMFSPLGRLHRAALLLLRTRRIKDAQVWGGCRGMQALPGRGLSQQSEEFVIAKLLHAH